MMMKVLRLLVLTLASVSLIDAFPTTDSVVPELQVQVRNMNDELSELAKKTCQDHGNLWDCQRHDDTPACYCKMTSAGQKPKELCKEIKKVWHCEDATKASPGSCMCEEPTDVKPQKECETQGKTWTCPESGDVCQCVSTPGVHSTDEEMCKKEGKTWDCGDADSGTVATCVCKDFHNGLPEKECEEEGKVWTCGEGEKANSCQCQVAQESAVKQTNDAAKDAAKEQCKKDGGEWSEDVGKCKEGTQMTPEESCKSQGLTWDCSADNAVAVGVESHPDHCTCTAKVLQNHHEKEQEQSQGKTHKGKGKKN